MKKKLRTLGAADKFHSGLFFRPVPFFQVALPAGCHHIVPCRSAVLRAGYYMVYGKLRASVAAILAGVVIPSQDVLF